MPGYPIRYENDGPRLRRGKGLYRHSMDFHVCVAPCLRQCTLSEIGVFGKIPHNLLVQFDISISVCR
jgi:hypothetical protein